MSDRLRVATLNLLYYPQGDRWRERRPLVEDGFRAIAPDVLGLQEVNRLIDQDHALGASGRGRYSVFRAVEEIPARYPRHWNAVVFLASESAGEVVGHYVQRLTHRRVVQALRIRRPSGATVTCLNTHLHHPDGPVGYIPRRNQVRLVLDWLAGLPVSDVVTLSGDLNAVPEEPAVELLRASGFHSAYETVHGSEPDTFPSGLVAPSIYTGPGFCVDYIWLRGTARVIAAELAWHEASPRDPTLYPSDHRGLFADVEISA